MRHSQASSLPDLNVTGAWGMGYTGRGQVVTFLDDGLEFDHPDLQENYVCLHENLCINIFFSCCYINRIERRVQISMGMMMIQPHVMNQQMKISKEDINTIFRYFST